MGGTITCPSSESRIATICGRLLAANGTDLCVQAAVLDSARSLAFAYPPNRILITRGALDQLDPDLLTAAIAHELGHLLDRRGVADGLPDNLQVGDAVARALRGDGDDDLRAEMRADQIGITLLRAAGDRVDALPDLLEHLAADPDTPTSIQTQLRRRASVLRSTRRIALTPAPPVFPPPGPCP